MPERIQRKRSKGWRMPPNTVSVTRPGRYGNPYFPGCGCGYGHFDNKGRMVFPDADTPEIQVAWFRRKMQDMKQCSPSEFESYIAPLRGKDLACWCPLDKPCHADVLLEIANR